MLNPAEEREPFRGDLLVGQNVFDREKFGLGQEERVRQPVGQALVEQLLRPDARADDPERLRNFAAR